VVYYLTNSARQRHSYNLTLIGTRIAPLPTTLNDIEGHFLLFEIFLTHILCETLHEFANLACRVVPVQLLIVL